MTLRNVLLNRLWVQNLNGDFKNTLNNRKNIKICGIQCKQCFVGIYVTDCWWKSSEKNKNSIICFHFRKLKREKKKAQISRKKKKKIRNKTETWLNWEQKAVQKWKQNFFWTYKIVASLLYKKQLLGKI